MATPKEWYDNWADNSDPDNINKGIISFARTLFPNIIESKYGVPDVHKDMYKQLLQLYNPKYTNYIQRQLQLMLARDFAKSTCGIFVFPLYLLCFNGHKIKVANLDDDGELIDFNGVETTINEDVIVIMSETLKMAENWALRIRREISVNRFLKTVFGTMKPESVRDDEGKWTASQFKCLKDRLPDKSAPDWKSKLYQSGRNATLVAKGANQQIRGLNIDGRVTTFLFDDLYSQKNTITPESRQKIRYMVSAEAKNGIDKNTGKVVFIGTMVHDDTLIKDNMSNKNYKVIKYTAMDKDKFHYVLNKYVEINSENRTCKIPTQKECKELEESGYVTNWKERYSLYILLSEYSEAFEGKIEGRTLGMFWQEKFHDVLSEEDKVFRQEHFKPLKMELVHVEIQGRKTTFIKIHKLDGNVEYRTVNIAIGIDRAISYSERADDTAIILVAKDCKSRVYFMKLMAGKFGTTDEFKDEYDGLYLDKLCLDRNKIKRIGAVDEVFRWLHGTNANCKIIIEVNSAGNETVRVALAKRRMYKMFYPVIEVLNTRNKIERISDALSPYIEMMYFNTDGELEQLKNQLEYLGKTTKDDCADIAGTVVEHLRRPEIEEKFENSLIAKPKKYETYMQKYNKQKYNKSKSYRDTWIV